MSDLLAALGFTRPPWMADAACLEHPDLDFVSASPRADVTGQKAVCAACLVRAECLAFAIEHHELGVWGGTTEAERRELRRAA